MSERPLLAVRGSLGGLDREMQARLFDRELLADPAVRTRVADIIRQVRETGDDALRRFAREFDGVQLDGLEVPRDQIDAALRSLDDSLGRAMRRAAHNIERVHAAHQPRAVEVESEPGITIGRRPDPLQRVGVYAPGGRAVYPSSVLMGAIPARVAGVREIVLCTPPARGSDAPSPLILAAAALSDVDRVFAIGGAGAIAAMAYGTAAVPRVDRIVGPGNAYVAEAKAQVSTAVAIDVPAGPSELLVIADADADARIVAREMLAQAEHDPDACVAAFVMGRDQAARVEAELARTLPRQARAEIIGDALRARGAVVCVESLDEAVGAAARYAPEHLLLVGDAAVARLPDVRNAGTIFVGASASVSFGDYMTGANHVLPTGGLARSYSGLSTLDFVRWTTYQIVDRDAARRLADDVAVFAAAEGLSAHARASHAWSDAPTGSEVAR